MYPKTVDHEIGGLTRAEKDGLGLSRDGVGHAAEGGAVQHEHAGGPAVQDLHPAAGAADAHHHGGGADIHGFSGLQRFPHVEEEVAGVQQNLQSAAASADLRLADGILLQRLGVIQAEPGIASLGSQGPVATDKAHVCLQKGTFACRILHVHRSLRLCQADGGGGGRVGQDIGGKHGEKQT